MNTYLPALAALALAALSIWLFFRSLSHPPEIGQEAPDFDLPDQNGARHRLGDSNGRWRVVCFYPRDDTPGCTRELCGLRNAWADLRALDAEVYGVSVDSVASHAAFAQKFDLPVPLLADDGGRVAAAYGSLFRFGPLRFAHRRSFLIAPDGRIAARWLKVSPAGHAVEIATALSRLQR